MSHVPQQSLPDGAAPSQNLANPAPSVLIMAQAPAPIKQQPAYDQRFPKKFMMVLSSIQLVMGALAIITNIIGLSVRYPEGHIVGTGIWCGIFYGLSGLFGIIASNKPSLSTIVTFMVMAIIASLFCLPLLVMSSLFTMVSWESHPCYRYELVLDIAVEDVSLASFLLVNRGGNST